MIFNFNKKKIASICLAMGMCLGAKEGNAKILSYNSVATLKDGREIIIYFMTGNSDDDYSFAMYNNQVGYIKNSNINYIDVNDNYYQEIKGKTIVIDNTYLYSSPTIDSNIVYTMDKNSEVSLIAKNENNWYVVMTSDKKYGFINGDLLDINNDYVLMAKITGNNVNVRSYPSTSDKNNIIGFCDKTDYFKVLGYDNEWYNINYLGQNAYVHKDYVREEKLLKDDLNIKKMVYVTCDTPLYNDYGLTILSILPQYQNAFVIKEENDYYRVMIDGVFGYIKKDHTKVINGTCVVTDLGRQITKVYRNAEEIFRAHIISGRQSYQTDIGCFRIGHHLHDYQLTPEYLVKVWLQYNGNEGIHDASWQNIENFKIVARMAYENYANGLLYTYPPKYGSHGCSNMTLEDAYIMYSLLNVGDTVLVIGPNHFVIDNLISQEIKKEKEKTLKLI